MRRGEVNANVLKSNDVKEELLKSNTSAVNTDVALQTPISSNGNSNVERTWGSRYVESQKKLGWKCFWRSSGPASHPRQI